MFTLQVSWRAIGWWFSIFSSNKRNYSESYRIFRIFPKTWKVKEQNIELKPAIFGLHNMVCFYFHHINALVWDGCCETLVFIFLQDYGTLIWTGRKETCTQCNLVFTIKLIIGYCRKILSLDCILLGKQKELVVAAIWALLALDFGFVFLVFYWHWFGPICCWSTSLFICSSCWYWCYASDTSESGSEKVGS